MVGICFFTARFKVTSFIFLFFKVLISHLGVILTDLVVNYFWVLCALIYSFPGKAVGVSFGGKAAASPVEAGPAKEVC